MNINIKHFFRGNLIGLLGLLAILTYQNTNFAVLANSDKVCPRGDVKREIPGNYEYSDGSGFINSTLFEANWGSNTGFEITDVCIKIGGPGGGELKWPDSKTGKWTNPTKYGISHIVLYTNVYKKPTPTITLTPTVIPSFVLKATMTPTPTLGPSLTQSVTSTITPTQTVESAVGEESEGSVLGATTLAYTGNSGGALASLGLIATFISGFLVKLQGKLRK